MRQPDEGSSIATWVSQQARNVPDAPALKQGGTQLSYAELDGLVGRAATRLAEAGVRTGHRVAMVMPNLLTFPIYYYAILRLGGTVVPVNPLLKADELAYVLRDASTRVAVVFAGFAEQAQKAATQTSTQLLLVGPTDTTDTLADLPPTTTTVPRAADDTAVVLYTSGTTGTPKGAELTHANIGSNVRTVLETLFPMGPGDVVFGGLPLFHSFGQTVAMNTAVAGGACLTLLPRFDPVEALRIIVEDQVTIVMAVPSMYVALLNTPGAPTSGERGTSRLRTAVSGGSSLPLEVLHGIEKRFGVTLLEGYGLSETSPVVTFNHPDRPSRPGSIGTAIRGCELDLFDADDRPVPDGGIGEIVIRGENVMKGYLNRPEDTAVAMRGGWFHSGDLARRDADGFYFIVDRVKDMIIRNGYNVYPREVEEILYAHPAVQEVAVVGVPHPELGEEIAALVTLKEGQSATGEELISYVRDRIAAYKYPRIVEFGAVPKGPTGKILKREIRLSR